MFLGSINDDSRSIIDTSIMTVQLVASFMIVIYYHDIFIVQATGVNVADSFDWSEKACQRQTLFVDAPHGH